MSGDHSPTYLQGLVRELCKLPRETEWVEFKRSNEHPQELGEYISALANAAALAGKTRGFRLQSEAVTNTTIRERFGIEEQNRAMASRLLRDAVAAGVLVPRDADAAPKLMQYVPWWASSTTRDGQ